MKLDSAAIESVSSDPNADQRPSRKRPLSAANGSTGLRPPSRVAVSHNWGPAGLCAAPTIAIPDTRLHLTRPRSRFNSVSKFKFVENDDAWNESWLFYYYSVCLTAEKGKKNRLSLEIPPCLAGSHSVITTTTQNNGYPRSDDISTKKFVFHLQFSWVVEVWPQGHCITELAIIWCCSSCSCSTTGTRLSLKAVAPARHDGEATGSGGGGQLQSFL